MMDSIELTAYFSLKTKLTSSIIRRTGLFVYKTMSAPNMLWWLLLAMLAGSSKFRTSLWSISQILRT
ncbi:unnamed protein product [Arabidopsis halleri]